MQSNRGFWQVHDYIFEAQQVLTDETIGPCGQEGSKVWRTGARRALERLRTVMCIGPRVGTGA